MKPSLTLLLVLALSWAESVHSAETLYKWTDKDGVTHYSRQPPPDQQADQLQLRTGKVSPQLASPASNAPQTYGSGEDPPEPPKPAEPGAISTNPETRAEQEKQLCERGRFLVDTLLPQPRAILTEPDGSVRALGDQERLDYIEEGRTLIERYCKGQR